MNSSKEQHKDKKVLAAKGDKVNNSFGVYPIYKIIRKNKWFDIERALTEHEFYSIIREMNKLMAEKVMNGECLIFPYRMGKLELRKIPCGVSLLDGKLKVTYPIDWKETTQLWLEDNHAKTDKLVVRHETPYVYKVKYCKGSANYDNKIFYTFSLNRKIKKALKDNIKSGKIDTLW